MKLKQLFEDVLNEPVFNYESNNDSVIITALKNRVEIGKVLVNFIGDGYWEFEDVINNPEYDFDERTYKKIFPNNKFAELDTLQVNNDERGQGIARKLVDLAMKYARSKGETVMYLNASPIGQDSISIGNLVDFYKSMGFQVVIDDNHNVEMFANL
jgi:ribosomal protein S18 acetylase RimI-like enzyme